MSELLIYSGRLTQPKGVLDLRTCGRTSIQPATLDYYGMGSDENALREAIQARGLSTSVEVHGPYHGEAEMGAIMEDAGLLVLLSDVEGFPMAFLEATAFGFYSCLGLHAFL